MRQLEKLSMKKELRIKVFRHVHKLPVNLGSFIVKVWSMEDTDRRNVKKNAVSIFLFFFSFFLSFFSFFFSRSLQPSPPLQPDKWFTWASTNRIRIWNVMYHHFCATKHWHRCQDTLYTPILFIMTFQRSGQEDFMLSRIQFPLNIKRPVFMRYYILYIGFRLFRFNDRIFDYIHGNLGRWKFLIFQF